MLAIATTPAAILASAEGLDAPQRRVPVARVVRMPGRKGHLALNRFPIATVPADTAKKAPAATDSADRPARCRIADEQRQHREHHEDVPLQRHPHRIADRMPKWKHSITNAAIAVTQPPWEKNSTSGTSISMASRRVPARATRDRPQVVGEVLEELAFDPAWADHRVVAHHRGDDEGEVLVELRRRRAHPDDQAHQLRPRSRCRRR